MSKTMFTPEKTGIPVYEADLKRIYFEEGKNFSHFKPAREDGAVEIVRRFFAMLEKDYDFPHLVENLVIPGIFGLYRSALRAVVPYEMPKRKLARLFLNWFIGSIGMLWKMDDGSTVSVSKVLVDKFLSGTYDSVFSTAISKLAKNNEDFYNQLEDYSNDETADFKQSIQRWRKGTSKVVWGNIKPILDFIYSKGKKETVHHLIGLYLLANTERALKNDFDIPEEEIYQAKKDILLWAQNKLPPDAQTETQCFLLVSGKYNSTDLSILQSNFIDPDYTEQKKEVETCFQYLYSNESITTQWERLVLKLKEICPYCKAFFYNWFSGRALILSNIRFDSSDSDKSIQEEALSCYRQAFDEGRNYAGSYLLQFLEEAIAVTVYFNRRDIKDIPKVIDPSKTLRTPINEIAKRYYEYGYALNLFEQESEETFFLHFHATEHFWKRFQPHQFVYSELANKKHWEDSRNRIGFHIIDENHILPYR
jgi:hypothetical protein